MALSSIQDTLQSPSISLIEMGQWADAAFQVSLGTRMQPDVLQHQASIRLQSVINDARARAPLYTQLYRRLRQFLLPVDPLRGKERDERYAELRRVLARQEETSL